MDMLHELTITVDDTVYQRLKPMVEQRTIGALLQDFLRIGLENDEVRQVPDIKALRGTLGNVDISDLRGDDSRLL
ncbi:MAG: hypothetical protein LBK61_01625 [Spirochaetaceae bacterium]|jgi:hypothetical protein|nr:hypothetical protein [Spirochaetaceae bacterium]